VDEGAADDEDACGGRMKPHVVRSVFAVNVLSCSTYLKYHPASHRTIPHLQA
jgi:hypothetical protein